MLFFVNAGDFLRDADADAYADGYDACDHSLKLQDRVI